MTEIVKLLCTGIILMQFTGCTQEELSGYNKKDGDIKVNLQLTAPAGKVIASRSNLDALMSYIDNIHVLIFGAGTDGIEGTDDDNVVFRHYLDYGVEQNIYLRSNTSYRIYVVANLDASNTNIGNAEHFFDDVVTLGNLKQKYIVASSRSVEQIGKIVMTTDGLIPVSLPNMEGGSEVTMKIPLSRLSTKVIFNVFNKVISAADKTVASGVFPVSWNIVNSPASSFLMGRPVQADGKHDYPLTGADSNEIASRYNQSMAQHIPLAEKDAVAYNGNWYTKQTFYLYTFENRRGNVAGLTDVYKRRELAPQYSTFVQITSYTTTKVLVNYIHIGKGRDAEPDLPDNITNFDVDRSCIYHMNVYINGIDDVAIDSRREYLDQHVIYMFPDISRIDGHYIDIPSFVKGLNGYVKLQTGTCDMDSQGNVIYNPDGNPRNFVAMKDTDPDTTRWLRISFYNPYRPSAKTSLYSSLSQRVDAYSGATPILHFNEFIKQPATTSGNDPIKRTAIIRVGYVSGALNATEYEQGVTDGFESVFYTPVSQYGIKTIGQVGGYDGNNYTSLLGVESVEEYTFTYYYRPPDNDTPNNGPVWYYRSGTVNHNQAYNGKLSTTNHYNDYRSLFTGGIPPKRREGTYDPVFNTNAADYCMRKNRDENGDGIISGSEVKWYLPTPAQQMQLSIWRGIFNFSFNVIAPFNSPYWTTNEADASHAYALDYTSKLGSTFTAEVKPINKNTRLSVRCVRDIPGSGTSAIYPSGSTVAVDLNGYYPSGMHDNKTGWSDNQIREPNGNAILQTTFLISRWYVTDKNNTRTVAPIFQTANKSPDCSNYAEAGQPAGTWRLPTQSELAFIYANIGVIQNIMQANFTGPNAYHNFIPANHWGCTNNGSQSTFWGIDFSSGLSQLYSSGNGYFRCVKYVSTHP